MPEMQVTNDQEAQLRRVLHDLSNTITGLLMNAGLLSLALRGNERLRRYAEEIHDGGIHSAELIQNARVLLDLDFNSTMPQSQVTDQCDVRAEAHGQCKRSPTCSCMTRM